MSSQSLLGLPPIPAPLKPITPFLQRANELRNQDFVMTYWCAYHAAQLGISLSAKDEDSRGLLFKLLGFLEGLKNEIGPSEAVNNQSVSAAYVENFALKVFTMADNEDRAGSATRGTAKKFLASAHFLELLKNFPKAGVTEGTDEKIKYAKWKAADIAKAFREGRKPTPGPAGSGLDEDLQVAIPEPSPIHIKSTPIDTTESYAGSPQSTDPQPESTPRFSGAHLDVRTSNSWNLGHGEPTPGSWSTAATPGTALSPQGQWDDQTSPAEGPTFAAANDQANVENEEFVGEIPFEEAPVSPAYPVDEISEVPMHLDPSPTSAGPSDSSVTYSVPSPGVERRSNVGAVEYDSTSVYSAASHLPTRSFNEPPFQAEDSITYQPGRNSSYSQQPPAPSLSTPRQPSQHSPPSVTVELTPSIIAKAQKHCRFALSSLDYEDADQAKKELRAALALLGG
ncbi:hypothetical protein H0H92_002123 [Tricholoma furcatifolium]|nr:hypothetical protein H0H92_002123 [Tricholoma furcatifolium]